MKSKHTAESEPIPTPLLGQDEALVDIFRGDEIIPDPDNRFVRECDYREALTSLAAAQKELSEAQARVEAVEMENLDLRMENWVRGGEISGVREQLSEAQQTIEKLRGGK